MGYKAGVSGRKQGIWKAVDVLLGARVPDQGQTILYKKVCPQIWTSQIYSFLEGKKFKNELMIIFSGMSCRVGSIASSRQSGRSRSYRTKSKRSEVDESLFGSANSAAKLRANCRSNKPETVQGQYPSKITII